MINNRRVADLNRAARAKCRDFLYICNEIGDFRVFLTSTLRDAEYQDKLYDEGKSPLRGGESWHQYGAAWDIAFRPKDDDKGATWAGPWDQVGQIADMLGIEWGGLWAKPDKCHFQYITSEARYKMNEFKESQEA